MAACAAERVVRRYLEDLVRDAKSGDLGAVRELEYWLAKVYDGMTIAPIPPEIRRMSEDEFINFLRIRH